MVWWGAWSPPAGAFQKGEGFEHEAQQTALPGGTGQPSHAPGQEPLAARALRFLNHLRGAAATLQTLFPLQEHWGVACCPPRPSDCPLPCPFPLPPATTDIVFLYVWENQVEVNRINDVKNVCVQVLEGKRERKS